MPTYVIESSWAWDKSHTEYATLGVEEFDLDSKPIKNLEDPDCPEEHKQFIFGQLKEIAEIQNGCAMAGPRLVAVYRVMAVEKQNKNPWGHEKVIFRLKPVFRFDDKGNPVPVR